ncbi:polysaccharide pyruvyl transferase family protein [Marinilabilia salmonicolor]|uniref:polysaccharide pyruvyl transferase family protein n=1 Tax=Marinilabilia salmonicolor TaxID=989 RepID=UPI00029AB434|nr:polysaccharide pyruvyl transferase family protein [Marinilabilia salmonicolor]
MNILIINQPLNNRGDEAAHKSLMRNLNTKFPDYKITVLFQSAPQDSINQFKVSYPLNEYINIKTMTKGANFIRKWALRLQLLKLSLVHPANYSIIKYIKEADFIVCAPGGICMGSFQNWNHIYKLSLASAYHKKVAYYSRSFGPFPMKTKWNRCFKNVSLKLLNNFDFISIRDAKTMSLAKKMNIPYVPAIDTAFLDTPNVNLPSGLKEIVHKVDYVIFVPNSLTWHTAFNNCRPEFIKEFYLGIMKLLLSKYQNTKILMLPQLFNVGKKSDEIYFKTLVEEINNKDIIVLSEKYNSDIQQTLISNAKLVVGARYHSIVFAINNNTPFVALSYEHKISGLLQILDLEKYAYNIENFGVEQPEIKNALIEIERIIEMAKANTKAKIVAHKIAQDCFNTFSKEQLKNN